MSDSAFDKFIKSKMEDYSSAVPEGLWEKIAQKQDKKRPFPFWQKTSSYVIITLVTAVVTGLLLSNYHSLVATKDATATSLHHKTFAAGTAKQNKSNSLVASVKIAANNTNAKILHAPNLVNTALKRNLLNINNTPDDEQLNGNTGFNSLTFNKRFNSFQDNKNEDQFSSALLREPGDLSTIEKDKDLEKWPLNSKILNDEKGFHLFRVSECPSALGTSRNDIYLEVYASPDYAFKTVTSGDQYNDFLKHKDSAETMRLSYSAGFRLSKTINDHFLLKAGLQYTQINEKFSLRTENESKTTTVITIRKVIRAAGDTIVVRDTSSLEQIGYRLKTTYNKYRSIDVPIMLAYEWGNDKIKASLNAGVILNIYSWQSGETLDTTYSAVPINKNAGQTFKQNIGVGLVAGLSIIKPMSEQTEIFAEPNFRYNISNMTSNKSLFNQRFTVVGVNLGIRYKLNNTRQHFGNK